MKRFAWATFGLIAGVYLVQLGIVGYFRLVPVDGRDFSDDGVFVRVKKSVYDYHFMPGAGYLLLVMPTGYDVITAYGQQTLSTTIDMRRDLKLEGIQIVKEDGRLRVIDPGQGVIAEFRLEAETGQ